MFTDNFYTPQCVIDDDITENRADLERKAKSDHLMARIAAITRNPGEFSIRTNNAHWLDQLIAIHILIDDYDKNFAEWGMEDSAKAFHEIIDIVGRTRIPEEK